jgi:hypothetical protein
MMSASNRVTAAVRKKAPAIMELVYVPDIRELLSPGFFLTGSFQSGRTK